MSTRQTTIRFPEITDRQLEDLAALYGDRTKAVVVAIDRLHRAEMKEATEMSDYRIGSEDRVAQVNWLNELADNIASNLGEGTADELVEYALSDEGRESWGIEIPEWFDDHDRSLLIGRVDEALAD